MTTKEESVDHENKVAEYYGGIRSKSSGAYIGHKYDVKTGRDLIECKSTGRPGEVKSSHILQLLAKQVDAAYEVNRYGALNMRYYDSEHPLSSPDGYVYFTVRLMADDLALLENQCTCGGACGCQTR